MTSISELLPGDIVDGPSGLETEAATFVAQTAHPIWPSLRLVIWKLHQDDSWSHDALDYRQDARRALLHCSQW